MSDDDWLIEVENRLCALRDAYRAVVAGHPDSWNDISKAGEALWSVASEAHKTMAGNDGIECACEFSAVAAFDFHDDKTILDCIAAIDEAIARL